MKPVGSFNQLDLYIYLVGGFKPFLVSISYMGCPSFPTDFHIFSRGVGQPPTSFRHPNLTGA